MDELIVMISPATSFMTLDLKPIEHKYSDNWGNYLKLVFEFQHFVSAGLLMHVFISLLLLLECLSSTIV